MSKTMVTAISQLRELEFPHTPEKNLDLLLESNPRVSSVWLVIRKDDLQEHGTWGADLVKYLPMLPELDMTAELVQEWLDTIHGHNTFIVFGAQRSDWDDILTEDGSPVMFRFVEE